MNLDDFSYTENDRRYINPQVSLDEQNAFIDNLRDMQQVNTAKITQDTRNLGTQVPSNLGGLGGGTSYFKSRYQTPQMNSMVSDLKAAAQSQALSTLMSNEIAKAKKRYNDAYRAAKKRSSGGGGGTNGNTLDNLGVNQTNRNGAGDKKNTSEVSSADMAQAQTEQKRNALQQARSNLQIWERRLDEYEKNPLGKLIGGYSQLGDIMNNVQKYRDEVARLESELGE